MTTEHPLVAFYAARLDEEEAAAKAAVPGPWRWADWSATFGTREQERNALEHSPEQGPFPAVARRELEATLVLHLADSLECDTDQERCAEHIVRHDPAQVLASVLADRHIIGRWTALQSPVTLMDRVTFPSLAEVVLACIRDRAARFKSHPGYDPSWAPED